MTSLTNFPIATIDSRLSATPFLQACRREAGAHTPVWLMRQAGRYMPEYRAIRERHSMLEVIQTPEIAAKVTLQPIDKFGFDAAIIFSDILPPLIGMGLDLQFVKGSGPRITNPLRCNLAIDRLATPPAKEIMGGTLEAIKLVSAELTPRRIPLIGFAGAPFTLACYAIEGEGSKLYEKAKQVMYREPAAWKRLMDKLVVVIADYLIEQVRCGASALQVFDSWAGVLSATDYQRFVFPYQRRLFEKVQTTGVPVINFSTGTSPYLRLVAQTGGDVIGVDWRLPIDQAWDAIGSDLAIQGNLDPVTLFAPWRELKQHIDAILLGVAGRQGHIFNLGHGILPETPMENVQRLVDYVHERTASGINRS